MKVPFGILRRETEDILRNVMSKSSPFSVRDVILLFRMKHPDAENEAFEFKTVIRSFMEDMDMKRYYDVWENDMWGPNMLHVRFDVLKLIDYIEDFCEEMTKKGLVIDPRKWMSKLSFGGREDILFEYEIASSYAYSMFYAVMQKYRDYTHDISSGYYVYIPL